MILDDYQEKLLERLLQVLGISEDTLTVHCRCTQLSNNRAYIMYIFRKYTKLSLREIGLIAGGYEHTTVMYHCQKMKDIDTSDYPCFSREKMILKLLEKEVQKFNLEYIDDIIFLQT